MPQRGSEEFGADPLPPMAGRDVHAPQVRFVRGLEMTVSIQSDCAHKVTPKRPDDHRLRRKVKLFPNRFGSGREVVRRRRGKRQRGIQQRFPPELDVGLSVVVSKFSNHRIKEDAETLGLGNASNHRSQAKGKANNSVLLG